MTIYGYARVSTDGQTLAAQEAALMQAGCVKIYSETKSGASAANRPALARALKALGEGDVLLVTRLDRLARSTRDLLNVLDTISKAGAGFRSLADAWADTTTPHGRLMLTVLGGLAEFERELIGRALARVAPGQRRAACAWGVRLRSTRTSGVRRWLGLRLASCRWTSRGRLACRTRRLVGCGRTPKV